MFIVMKSLDMNCNMDRGKTTPKVKCVLLLQGWQNYNFDQVINYLYL